MGIVCMNGQFEEEDLSPREAGLNYHFLVGIYETLRTVRGRLFNWVAHAERLKHSAEGMGFEISPGRLDMFEEFAQRVVDENMNNDSWPKDLEARVRLQVDPEGHYYVQVLPLLETAQMALKEGVSVVTRARERSNPEVKAIDPDYVRWAHYEKQTSGADEILLVNNEGNITEGSMSNLFIVTQAGVLVTPNEGILKGTVRQRVLDLAQEFKWKIEYLALTQEDVENAREVFICSVSREAIPVVKVDETVIGEGRPGFMTLKLARELKKKRLETIL